MELKCYYCIVEYIDGKLRLSAQPLLAETVYDGYALCIAHIAVHYRRRKREAEVLRSLDDRLASRSRQ